MGCPVRKVCRVGGGSAMMTELGRTQSNALFVLDEPSVGLHPRDTQRLVEVADPEEWRLRACRHGQRIHAPDRKVGKIIIPSSVG